MFGTVSGATRTSGPPTSPATKPASIGCGSAAFGRTPCCWCGVILSVALLDPGKPIARHRLASVAVPAGSRCSWGWWRCRWPWAAATLRRANRFNYAAIVEVAVLFFGIFICMQPALQILAVEGPNLGLTRAVALLLGLRQPLVGARQRPDLRGILRDGQIAHRDGRPDAGRGRRGRAPAGRH